MQARPVVSASSSSYLCFRLQVINTILRMESRASLERAATAPLPAGVAAVQEPILCSNGAPYGAPRRVFIWDSLFLARLLSRSLRSTGHDTYCYHDVALWADLRGLDVRSVDWIIVPLHLGAHWVRRNSTALHLIVHTYLTAGPSGC